jgi:hypothetical protein
MKLLTLLFVGVSVTTCISVAFGGVGSLALSTSLFSSTLLATYYGSLACVGGVPEEMHMNLINHWNNYLSMRH